MNEVISKPNKQSNIQLSDSWLYHLWPEFEQPYMKALKQFLQQEKQAGKTIYPPGGLIFNALNTTALDQVKVVILGQDPYHGVNQAHGLSFSVKRGVKIPPSLMNIYKEIQQEYGVPIPTHGCLQAWAEQGVLLLNATLTVEQGRAGSHQNKGWERFTDQVIQVLNRQCDKLVFLLWGSYAQKKGGLIDTKKHLILKSPHPSPLSAHRGFLGNNHFTLANEWLQSHGVTAVTWAITD